MTLARKVLVPTVLLGMLLAGGVALVAWDAVSSSRLLERNTSAVRTTTALAYALDDAAQEEDRAVLAAPSSPDSAREQRITRATERIVSLEGEIGRVALAPRAAAIWAQFRENRALLGSIRDALVDAVRRGDAARVSLELSRWRLITARSDALLRDFAGYHLRHLDRTVAELQDGRMRALRATILASALAVLVAVGLAIAVGRAVVRPIVAVAHAAEQIADTGRLSQVAGGERADEIGTLARAFNRMTERLFAANAHLEESDRRKDEFLGMLSHELRNPLAPLRSSLFILDHVEPGTETARKARAVASRQVVHLTNLVDDLLDVTRIARGKIELRRTVVDLVRVVHRCAEDHAEIMRDRRHELRVSVPEGLALSVEGDETRLVQVVGNLLVNAAKFTAPGGQVTLTARAASGCAEVRVRDTGAGIDAELLPRVFEPFTQGKQGLARSDGGLGLGLSLVKGIIELHGGTVAVHSDGPGRGAEFTVRVPLVSADDARAPAPARPAPRDGPGHA